MQRRVQLATFALLFLQAMPAAAQVKMEWKFKDGEEFFIEEKTSGKMSMKFEGMAMDMEQKSVRLLHFVVKSRSREGMVLEQRTEAFSSEASIMGNPTPADTEVENLMKSGVFTFKLSPEGKVTEFTGYKEFAKNFADAIANADETKALILKMMQSMVTEDLMRAGIVDLFDVLPSGAVKGGDTWKHTQALSFGPIGAFKVTQNMTYKGQNEKELAKVDTKGEFEFDVAKKADDSIPFKITKFDFATKSYSGHMLFDAKAGRLTSGEFTTQMSGTLGAEAAGMQFQVELDGTQTMTRRLTSKRPEGQK
jgi:hypothetical protein